MPDSAKDERHWDKVTGSLQPGVTAKDIALAIISEIGTAGGTGFAIEFCSAAIQGLTMEVG